MRKCTISSSPGLFVRLEQTVYRFPENETVAEVCAVIYPDNCRPDFRFHLRLNTVPDSAGIPENSYRASGFQLVHSSCRG